MLEKYKVEMPDVYTKLEYGFSMHEKTNILIVEAKSITDINTKYPNAISIEKLQDDYNK